MRHMIYEWDVYINNEFNTDIFAKYKNTATHIKFESYLYGGVNDDNMVGNHETMQSTKMEMKCGFLHEKRQLISSLIWATYAALILRMLFRHWSYYNESRSHLWIQVDSNSVYNTSVPGASGYGLEREESFARFHYCNVMEDTSKCNFMNRK